MQTKRKIISIVISATVSVLLVAGVVLAVSTIGTDITTGGDVAVNGGDITTTAAALNISDGANNLMTITDGGAVGNVNVTGTLNSAGAFSVATNKLTVAAGTGNTAVAGTLTVGGGTAVAKVISEITAAINLGSAAANTCVVDTAAVTGAALGDAVIVSPLIDDAAWDTGSLTAFVEGPASVKIVYCNPTVGVVDPGSMTYRLTIIQF